MVLIACEVFALSSCMDDYIPYVPVVVEWEGGDLLLKEDRGLLTEEHTRCMQVVLKRYGESYYMRDGTLFIPKRLHDDRELLWNYTSKAESLRSGTWHP